MTTKTLEIHSENILPIIKKWLYSDRDIFLRELISNACDAIRKLKVLRDQGKTDVKDEEFRIDVRIDKKKKTITISDTGIGMTAEEVEKYIAQIAFSGAEDFMQRYKSEDTGDQFIGHFGLGFYSAYMVAKKVEIQTLSYEEGAKPVYWACDGTRDYEIDKGIREKRGTEIVLHVNNDSEEFLEETKVKQVLDRYLSFLPYPIYLGEKHINHFEPLWVKNPSECTEKEYLEFYRHLYPMEAEPLFWVHLNVDYPFHLKGILYFPKITREFDLNKSRIKLFCNRVFVSDDTKDIVPNYLSPLRGVIESPDIPLNVSRSYLQVDKTVRQLSQHISKKVADSLHTLWHTDRERFLRCWDDLSVVVKLGALEEEKFYERVKDLLIWKTTDGEWMSAGDYADRFKEKTSGKIYYVKDATQLLQFVEIYKAKQIPILLINHWLDSYVMPQLEGKLNVKFQRIDAAVEDAILDKEREKTVLDAEGKTAAAKLADFVRSMIDSDQIEVDAKSLAADGLPGFVVIGEEERRMKEWMKMMHPEQAGAMPHLGKTTFVVNTNNSLMEMAHKLQVKDPVLAKQIVKYSYDLALLSQQEMDPTGISNFVNESSFVLQKLTELASKDAKDEKK